EAIEILKRNGGVRKLPRRQLWHFGKHKIRLDEDGIIEEAEKYLKRESTPPPPITSSPTKKRRKGGGSAMIDMDTLDDLLEAVAGDMGGSKAEWARLWGDKLKGMIWDEIREGK
ncbi:MAG TPA: hypothetical protein VLL52_14955, partial [Anaerolineae bacterium]|nr:hypothetical protein [Anaerolineae bacterium]